MRNRSVLVATAVVASAVAGVSAGCGGQADGPARQQPNAQITVDSASHSTHAITCTKIEWWLTIEASADQADAQAILHVDADKPAVKTVTLDNFDGFHGVAGEGKGHVAVTFANDVYTITGDAEGWTSDHPDVPKTVPFKIQARC